MDQSYFNTIEDVRKSGSHLSLEERGESVTNFV